MKMPYKRILLLLTFTVQQHQTLLFTKVTEVTETADSEKNNIKSLLPYSIPLVICTVGYFSFLKGIRDIPQQAKDRLQEEREEKEKLLLQQQEKEKQEQQKLEKIRQGLKTELEKIRQEIRQGLKTVSNIQLKEFPDFQLKYLNGNYYLAKNGINILYSNDEKITYVTEQIKTTEDREKLLMFLEIINNNPEYLGFIKIAHGQGLEPDQIETLIKELNTAIEIGKTIEKLGFSLDFYGNYYLVKDGIHILRSNHGKITYTTQIQTTEDREKLLMFLKIINNNPEYLGFINLGFIKIEPGQGLEPDQIETLIKELNTVIKIRNAIQHLGFSLGYFGGDYYLSGDYYLAKNGINILFLNGDEITYCKDQIKTTKDRENLLEFLKIIKNNSEYLEFFKKTFYLGLTSHEISYEINTMKTLITGLEKNLEEKK